MAISTGLGVSRLPSLSLRYPLRCCALQVFSSFSVSIFFLFLFFEVISISMFVFWLSGETGLCCFGWSLRRYGESQRQVNFFSFIFLTIRFQIWEFCLGSSGSSHFWNFVCFFGGMNMQHLIVWVVAIHVESIGRSWSLKTLESRLQRFRGL